MDGGEKSGEHSHPLVQPVSPATHHVDAATPMVPLMPLNRHDCDPKGGKDSCYERYHVTRLPAGGGGGVVGVNGFNAARTRTVSSGYTSDKDLDDMMHGVSHVT